jgi:hypothetical protein
MNGMVGRPFVIAALHVFCNVLLVSLLAMLVDWYYKPNYNQDPGPLGYEGTAQLIVGELILLFLFMIITPVMMYKYLGRLNPAVNRRATICITVSALAPLNVFIGGYLYGHIVQQFMSS